MDSQQNLSSFPESILSLHCLFCFGEQWYTCSNTDQKSCKNMEGIRCGSKRKKINLDSISQKILVTHYFEITRTYQSPFIIPKNIHSISSLLRISNVEIPFGQFLRFGESVKFCYLHNITVKHDDDNERIVSLPKIIQCLPLVEEFYFCGKTLSSHITPSTVEELFEIPHFSKIKEFAIYYISEDFDIETFYHQFLKMNDKTMDVQLYFDRDISDIYRERIKAVMDKISKSASKPKIYVWIGQKQI